jgi:hypothetical protein
MRREEEYERIAIKTGVSAHILKGTGTLGATLGGTNIKRLAKVKEKQPDYSRCRSPDKNTFFDKTYRVFYASMMEDTVG